MRRMRTFIDADRLMPETDRRFHAADLEYAGGSVQIVPATAYKLAPRTAPGAWGRNEQRLKADAQEVLSQGDTIEWTKLQRERWWNRQWSRKNPLYTVCTLDKAERELAIRLVSPGGLDPDCFPDAQTPLHEHNDAVMIAQIAALGGTMLITSEKEMVDEALLARWLRTHREQFALRSERLVYNADALFMQWAEHPTADRAFLRTTIGAYWPERQACGLNEAREAIRSGIETLTENKMPRFGHYLRSRFSLARDITQIMREVQKRLPERMRQGEHEYREILGLETQPQARNLQSQKTEPRRWPSDYEW